MSIHHTEVLSVYPKSQLLASSIKAILNDIRIGSTHRGLVTALGGSALVTLCQHCYSLDERIGKTRFSLPIGMVTTPTYLRISRHKPVDQDLVTFIFYLICYAI